MKIVIPFLYNSDTISISNHKLLLTALKSYIFNQNTTPLIVAITNNFTKLLLDNFIQHENCGDVISYQYYDKQEVFNDMSEYMHFKHHFGNIARSKFFCVRNVATDDDIIICDTDMLFVKKIDWKSHILPDAKVQFFENYYIDSTCSGNLGIFINRCAYEGNFNVFEYLNELRKTSSNYIDTKMPWPNGGLVYYSKKYRQNEFEQDVIKYKQSPWYRIQLYEEEPFYVYLYHNSDNIKIEQNSSLNKRIYTWTTEEIFDPFNIPNCEMIHYCLPKCKPTEFQFTWKEGYILRDIQESIYDCSPEGTIWNEFFTRTATTRILLILWHYYYSFVSQYVFNPNEYLHPPETFLKIINKFKESNQKLKDIYSTDF